ncbi:MAG: transporter substrate-binding domain-containing protein [Firmicutes bacterium]|nr:transporter substrate-binding domain-containing protein [Bacillota bacterium]
MKKFILLALAALTILAFAACRTETPERRTLVMGTSAGFFPFEFIADHGRGVIGQYAGIDVSLVARIAQELDVDIIIQDQEFAGLILALQNREIDFIAAAMTIRPDRQEQVNFTIPYFNAGQYVIVRADDTSINSMADLEGKIVGVQLGTTGDIAVSEGHANGIVTFQEIAAYNQPVPGVMDLMSGSIDAFVIDAPVARGFFARYPNDIRIFADPGGFFGPEVYGMAFHKDDVELLAEFNAVLERLIAEGYVQYLYDFYNREFAPPSED